MTHNSLSRKLPPCGCQSSRLGLSQPNCVNWIFFPALAFFYEAPPSLPGRLLLIRSGIVVPLWEIPVLRGLGYSTNKPYLSYPLVIHQFSWEILRAFPVAVTDSHFIAALLLPTLTPHFLLPEAAPSKLTSSKSGLLTLWVYVLLSGGCSINWRSYCTLTSAKGQQFQLTFITVTVAGDQGEEIQLIRTLILRATPLWP